MVKAGEEAERKKLSTRALVCQWRETGGHFVFWVLLGAIDVLLNSITKPVHCSHAWKQTVYHQC